MQKFLIPVLVLCVVSTYAVNPPRQGKFPAKLVEALRDNPDLIQYGDPGWIKKLEGRRAALKNTNGNRLAKIKNSDLFVLPVLLAEFPDGSSIISKTTFQNTLFDNNPTGTMTQYYNEVSYVNFQVTGTVYDWVTVSQNRTYYEGNNNGYGTYPQSAKGLVREVVELNDASVNFGKYDNDGPDGVPNSGDDDGYADAVGIVYTGAGPDWSPGNSHIWPHMSSLGDNEFTTNDAKSGGGNIKVRTYFICPEQGGSGDGNGSIRPIGVYVHEFGHVLGLPDLYDRTDATEGPDFEPSNGIGEWGLMASGSWGGDGDHTETPSHMTAWSKIQMGWLNPTEITSVVDNLALKNVEANAQAWLLWEDAYAASSYFLIENRQKNGFDKYLNGDGMIIYHVDENQRWGPVAWSSGWVNDDETHKLVDIEEADGLAHLDNSINRGDSGDTFPGSSNNTSFTDSSIPNAKDYNGQASGVSITNISSSSSTMTANVKPRQNLGYMIKYDEGALSGWGWGFQDPADSWGGVKFFPSSSGKLTSVDFGLREAGIQWEILVYGSFSGSTPGTLLSSKSGTADFSGWHTVQLDDEINITANSEFFVAIKIIGKSYAISYDPYGALSGRSYFSGTGTSYSSNISGSGDINLRVRIQTTEPTAIDDNNEISARSFQLFQNYPNPFNPETKISYLLQYSANVKLTIFDNTGKEILQLVNQFQTPGLQSVTLDASNLPSGVYFYRLAVANGFMQSRKMVLLK